MNRLILSSLFIVSLSTSAWAQTAPSAPAQTQISSLPAHGASTSQVEAQFGAPLRHLPPVGGQKPQWPTINRWVYPDFTVYFENGRVIDAVVNPINAEPLIEAPPSN